METAVLIHHIGLGMDVAVHIGNEVTAVVIANKAGLSQVKGKIFIDATGDGDISVRAGAEYNKGNPETGKNQPMSLRYIIDGIDMNALGAFFNAEAQRTGVTAAASVWNNGVEMYAHCCRGTTVTLTKLFEEAIEAGDLTVEDHIYWQAFGMPGRYGSIAFNCPEFFENIDGTNPEDLSISQVKGKEAIREKVISYLNDVGIPDPERRYKQYAHEFSGGMRQRVVIAIALACNPKILICDEPTTALDVTIQAQIINLLKELKEKYSLTIVFITHDLGVVANIADRVAVMYCGDIIEVGMSEEVFYDPKHPYTWALLSSLPQLGERGEDLFTIKGTPPSLYKEIKGDAFAPRNPRALKIDYMLQPPYFEVTPTHKAKTWLLDPRAPKVEPPAAIRNLKDIEGVYGK